MSAKHQTWVSKTLFEKDEEGGAGDSGNGIGTVLVVRQKGKDWVEAGFFLVDRYCLGVKDAWFDIMTREDLEERTRKVFPEGYLQKNGAWGRKFVESAVRYARGLGFAPAADYKKGARVFGGVRAEDCQENFAFGYQGKPYYIQGPHEDWRKVEQILSTLRRKCGEDGFHFLAVNGPFEDDEEDEDDDGLVGDGMCLYGQQTGGGSPCAELLENLEYALKATEGRFFESYHYEDDYDDVALDLEDFCQKFHGVLKESLSGKEHSDLEAYSLMAVDLLLKCAQLEPQDRGTFFQQKDVTEEALAILESMADNPVVRRALDYLLKPDEETSRIFLSFGYDQDQEASVDPWDRRFWVVYAEYWSDS